MNSREAQLQTKVQELETELVAARHEIQLLRQKLDRLARRVFGCGSEKLSPGQLQLLLALAGEPEAPRNETPRPPEPVVASLLRVKTERKPRLPEHLPVVEEVIDPEPVKAQPEAWRCIGEEVTEQLDYEPAKFIRRRLIRRTFVHRTDKDRAPVTAPLPPCLQERCLAAPGLLAQVVVSKYADHLPLYRQQGGALTQSAFGAERRVGAGPACPAGSSWSATGCNRFTGTCGRKCSRRVTCRSMKPRCAIWPRATGRPSKATSGPPTGPAGK